MRLFYNPGLPNEQEREGHHGYDTANYDRAGTALVGRGSVTSLLVISQKRGSHPRFFVSGVFSS
jgi:hypothetical protein